MHLETPLRSLPPFHFARQQSSTTTADPPSIVPASYNAAKHVDLTSKSQAIRPTGAFDHVATIVSHDEWDLYTSTTCNSEVTFC